MAFTTLLRRLRPSTVDPRIATSEPRVVTTEKRAVPVRRSRDCRDQAKRLIHKYAAFGTVWALLPVPMATSAGLALLETHLIYWIARIYGEEPKKTDVLMTAAGLELASVGLKTIAIEGAALVPVIGLGVKASLAGSVVLAIGAAIVGHYEHKYPGKQIAA